MFLPLILVGGIVYAIANSSKGKRDDGLDGVTEYRYSFINLISSEIDYTGINEDARAFIDKLSEPIYGTYLDPKPLESTNHDELYLGFDLEDAQAEMIESNRESEYDNEQLIYISKYTAIFNKDKAKEFIELSKTLSEDEFYDRFSKITDAADFIELNLEYDVQDVDSLTIPEINESTDELIYEVQSELANMLITEYEVDGYKLQLSPNTRSKYNNLNVTANIDDEDYDVGTIELRIADHSYNPQNNSMNAREGNFISVVIANKNATKNKFSNAYSLYFDEDNDVNDVAEEVNERIDEILNSWNIEEKLIENSYSYAELKKELSGVKKHKFIINLKKRKWKNA